MSIPRRVSASVADWHAYDPASERSACFSTAVALNAQSPINAQGTRSAEQSNSTNQLSDSVKRLMRHVPHPVAVITSTDLSASPDGGPEGWRGATVSSFNTVTLYPDPVVSFNIREISSTYDAIRNSGIFNIHLMSETSEAMDIASKFAGGNASAPFHDDEGELERYARLTNPTQTASSGRLPPILQSWNEAGHLVVPLRLQCHFMEDKTVQIGDHVVLFGKVAQIFHDENAFHDQAASRPKPCLVYVNGRYSRVDSHSQRVPFVQLRKITTICG